MTDQELRDQFAMRALPFFIETIFEIAGFAKLEGDPAVAKVAAQKAYLFADAMMEARK